MIERIKIIYKLSKMFFQNSFEGNILLNKDTNKTKKKSLKFWVLIVVLTAITYLSYMLIKELTEINQQVLFLHLMLPILMIIILFQVILSCINVYYFSRDLELILPLPIKPKDILIAKFNTIILNSYVIEFIFIVFPLIIYGIYTATSIMYFLYLIILLAIFPILPALIISIIMMFLMKFSKFIKNKDIFQIFVTFIFVILILICIFLILKQVISLNSDELLENSELVQERIDAFYNKLDNIDKYFLQITPSINILHNRNTIVNFLKIIILDIVLLEFFMFIGNKIYLKNILKNYSFNITKKSKKINLQKKCKKINKGRSYIKKEFKVLFNTPIFFIQCIYPTIIMCISIIILLLVVLPRINMLIQSNYLEVNLFDFNFKKICLLIAGIQIILTLSNTSLISISKDGKNAIFMKYIPVDLYKQIIYKSLPQIIINSVFISILLIALYIILPNINFIYYIYIFTIASLINIFNSIFIVTIDLRDPNLNWNAEYEVVKQNNKKLYQYILTIIIILLLSYLSKILIDMNIHIICLLLIAILAIILIVFNLIIKKHASKLFTKII